MTKEEWNDIIVIKRKKILLNNKIIIYINFRNIVCEEIIVKVIIKCDNNLNHYIEKSI